MRDILRKIRFFWLRQRLTNQFLAVSAAVFIAGMAVAGAWISERIESGVTQNTAASTALYFDSFVAPVVQDLASGDTLPIEKRTALEKLIHETPIGHASFPSRSGGATA
jgi:hypothetical protein